ncbi:efflux RND transporter periplasmic adaptor subunit [Variovorax sp. J22G21]|uniref:efflux RND transporter periplasmic adaptor subunit n=1 Tax=Variovorax fucosicus TaxID=3053517 RepID=UPI00257822BE|nr:MULTISPECIES: efflux RND transporter periplasmic adaptor subunit [unclassified Variovorax]MDM0042114.1 efflux RND transporter periplasmic adaptor subunit [Variovorax sp. J22R193]MDM0057197.1 efflux RND transporter periplasmic adaptor subunit [Variovorax sp. J22G47]MDM0059884.1 efflux RND transporter periplasmic adaptor subunit [Variovorax sp. J22G21]
MTAFSSIRATPLRCGAALLLIAALAACTKPPPPEEPVRAVKVITIGASAFASEPEFSAEVKARVESRLGFRVAGKIIKRQVDLGQHVKAGQVLAQLDPQDYRLAAEAARAQSAAALTNRDLASADLKRYRELKEQNFISGAELERRETTYKAAQAQLEQAQAQLSSQGNQASYTTLVADVSGVVTAVEAEPGQVVTAGMTVVRIAQDGPRDVVFAVPEDRAGFVKVGSPVTVRGWANDSEQEGTVREVAASADPVTRTYSVKVAIDAADAPALGATVYARPKSLARSGTPVIKLPTSALREEGKATAVWVLDKATMTVRSQPVQLATADGNEAVVAGGLTPGMLVVVAGVHVLSPNQKVTVYESKVGGTPVAPAPGAVKTVAPAASGAAR